MSLCPFEYSYWCFTHERLSVCVPFACDDEVGIGYNAVEVYAVKQQVDAAAALCIKELHEGITQAAGSSCSRLL